MRNDYYCVVCDDLGPVGSKDRILRHMFDAHVHVREKEYGTLIHHGQDRGYYAHRRLSVPFPEDAGGDPCGCRAAHAKAVARWYGQWRRGYGFNHPAFDDDHSQTR